MTSRRGDRLRRRSGSVGTVPGGRRAIGRSGSPLSRRILVCSVLALAACAPRAGTIRNLDEKNGFRDASFDTPLSEFEDMKFVELREGMACYRRENENLSVGDAALLYIHYCFVEGRLASVVLRGAGAATAGALAKRLRTAYGRGEPLFGRDAAGNRHPVGQMWSGERVSAVLLFVRPPDMPFADNAEVVVTLSSNPLLARRDALLRAPRAGQR
jgi:hypothetical protein